MTSSGHQEAQVRRTLNALNNPTSVAVIGASDRIGSLGEAVSRALREGPFDGRVLFVNPNHASVGGAPTRPEHLALKERPDVVFICLGASRAGSVIHRCVEAHIPLVVVLSEDLGLDHSEALELIHAAREGGTRIVGPNCMGIYDARAGISWTVRADFKSSGSAALVSHSGGIAQDLLLTAPSLGFSFLRAASLGNCIDLDEVDFLEFYGEDSRISAIGVYIEGSGRPRRVIETIQTLTAAGKSIVVLKGGRSDAAAEAVATHTGKIAGDYQKWNTLLRQAGGIVVDTPADLVGCLALASRLPNAVGSCAFVGNGGGASVLIADWSRQFDIELANLDASDTRELASAIGLPAIAHGAIWDVPLNRMIDENGATLETLIGALARRTEIDTTVCHLNLVAFLNQRDAKERVLSIVRAISRNLAGKQGVLVFRTDGSLKAETLASEAREIAHH